MSPRPQFSSVPHVQYSGTWTTTATTLFFITSSSKSVSSLPYKPSACAPVLTVSIPQTSSDAWFKPTEENIHAGVCLRVAQGRFRVFPYENPYLQPFERAIKILNPVAAVKVRSAAIHAALSHLWVRTSFDLNLTDISLDTAQRMHNRSLSIKIRRSRSSIL